MDWLLAEILTGFQKLLCLGLERQPAAEVLTGTAQAWVECLGQGRAWDAWRDTPRIRQAFVVLARTRRQWPAPVDFLEALPAIGSGPAAPLRRTTPERAAAAIAEVRAMLAPDRKTLAAGGDK